MFTNIKSEKRLIFVVLLLILGLASVLRFYKLDQVPPAIYWDEAANGYNAYTIANWGRDEWGKFLPTSFKSFGDDKNPVHIYLTVIPVRILGLNEFSTRLPAALMGILGVLMVYLLGEAIFNNKKIGLISALVFAVSPYTLQFSRFNHEAIFTIFFFMLGLWLFLKGVKVKPKLIPLSFFVFGVSILTYHSAKIVVPPVILLLIVLYFKDLWKQKGLFLGGLIILGIVMSVFIFNPALLGMARASQTSVPVESIQKMSLYKKTGNELLGRVELSWQRYLTYFGYDFLFVSGDKIARHSSQGAGEFYRIDLIFLVIGLLSLIRYRRKESLILLSWAVLAPIPGSIAGGITETAHAGRSLFIMGSWHLLAGLGYYSFLKIFRKTWVIVIVGVILLGILGWQMKDYLNYYYGEYVTRYAIEWQYGMKQISQYLQEHDGYSQVYITDARVEPYIFLLYYMQVPLPRFLDTVYYNDTQSRPSNLVTFFDKYHFGDWDPIESFPNPGVLYVLTPSQYDGLRYKQQFKVKKLIKYPNGLDAFYLVALY